MAFSVNRWNWTFVSSRIRTRIYQGPLLHGVPVQWIEFGTTGAEAPVNFSVNVYSAAAPWYMANSGTVMAKRLLTSPSGRFISAYFPWEFGFPLWLLASPWVEIVVTTDRNCMAHVYLV